MTQPRFILSGGGTGGHIYPAIAIANELRARFPECEILFVGASDKMEMQKVPQAGYKIKGLWISGLQRKLTVDNTLFPLKLVSSMVKALDIVRKFKPDVVIGTGGFASGPLLQVAALRRIPTVVQEQNSFPGITNKILAARATKICVAYENLEKFFPKSKLVLTGNPVRKDLIFVAGKRSEGREFFKLLPSRKTLLVLGGSLGSRRINELIASKLKFLEEENVEVIWQCGKIYFDQYKDLGNDKNVHLMAFIDNMDLAYSAADIIISRAGASSVSELCIVGKPVIFIPSPNVAEDHQTKNADSIVKNNAALMIKESELDIFEKVFANLLHDAELSQKLSGNIKNLAKADATDRIVDEIIKIVPARKQKELEWI